MEAPKEIEVEKKDEDIVLKEKKKRETILDIVVDTVKSTAKGNRPTVDSVKDRIVDSNV